MFAVLCPQWLFFFFNDTATTEIYTLSLHDALPIYRDARVRRILEQQPQHPTADQPRRAGDERGTGDRKSTRLNSSHLVISYAVFCLKKKKTKKKPLPIPRTQTKASATHADHSVRQD